MTVSSQNSRATVPPNLTIASGQSSGTFTVSTTVFGGNSDFLGNITAAAGGSTRTAALTVQPIQFSNLSTGNVQGGGTTSGVASINRPAPGTGIQVVLGSANPAATVPASITISGGQSSGNFSVTTVPVATDTGVQIQASFEQASRSTTVTVLAPNVDLLTLTTSSIRGGTSVAGSVRINGQAPAGGLLVNLSSSNSAVASVPPSITVPAGQTTADFTVTTFTVSSNSSITLQASRPGGAARTAALVVTP